MSTTPPGHPEDQPQGHPQRWLILGVICLAQLTVLLDNTVLNVAIPSLTRELGAATSDIQWMINAYSLVQSGLLLTAGSAADRYGRKKMLIAGLVLFGIGSVVALGLAAVVALVPESKSPRGDRPDLLGALLSTIGMTALVYAIISGPEHGWTSGRVLATDAVAVLVLAAFAYWESRIPYPMLDLHFFRDRRFTGAVAGAVLITFGMGGALFLLTQHLQFVLGYGPLEAGLRTAPLALAVVALNFSGLSAKWTARLGTPVSIALGMTLMSAGLVSIATLAAHGYGGTLLGLLLIGAGAAVANPAMAHAIMSAIPPEKAGVGAGINGTLAEFGNGLGVAVLGAILNSRFAALIPVAAASLPAALASAGSEEERGRITDAFSSGLETSQLVGAVAVLLGGLLAAALLRRAERADSAVAVSA
ncbi:MFS transporter [Streptomyces mirabilis]|uniref:MFS transporter n=1 Tax=Streptomyces mirabilis TaxID=68239 RepID=UPI00167E1059|nr:MFS transporter [Streptomyces mirabilis]